MVQARRRTSVRRVPQEVRLKARAKDLPSELEAVVFAEQGPGRDRKVLGLTSLQRSLLGFDKAGVARTTLLLERGEDPARLRAELPPKLADAIRFVTRQEGESDVEALRRCVRPEARVVTWRSNVAVGPKDADAIAHRPLEDGRVLSVADGLVHVVSAQALRRFPVGSVRDLARTVANQDALDRMAEKVLVQDFASADRRRAVEKGLIQGLLKPIEIDGVLGVYFQRPISTRISRLLSRTSITPNQITAVAMILGVASGFFVAAGGWFWTAIGGLLFLAGSLVDCCDGEIARLKFQFSRTGEWFDTIADDLSTLSFLTGMGINLYGVYPSPWILGAGVAASGGFFLTQAFQYYKLLTVYHCGDLTAIQFSFTGESEGKDSKLFEGLKYLVKRDLFSVLFCVVAVANLLEIAFFLAVLGSLGAFVSCCMQAVADWKASRPAPAAARPDLTLASARR
jgi:phosphatidylserine synthase